MNRTVTNNEADIVGQSDVISWGRFMFQNSSECKEVLDAHYQLYIRKGDQAGEMDLTMGFRNINTRN